MSTVTTGRRIGLLGGTFDPIHAGHLDVARAAQRELSLTCIHFVTAQVPPHRTQPVASSFHRFAMTALAVAGVREWRASDLELRLPPPSYTSQTLERFRERGYDPSELFFILGADAFKEIHLWRDYPRILGAATFVVVSRPGLPVKSLALPPDPASGGAAAARVVSIDAPTADVSSTAIRQRRALGQSIAGLVPESVQQHIEQHGLYSPMPPDRRSAGVGRSAEASRVHGEN